MTKDPGGDGPGKANPAAANPAPGGRASGRLEAASPATENPAAGNSGAENRRAVLWALAATALFSLAAALAKRASAEVHVLEILFFRQMIVLASTLPALARGFPASLKTRRPALHAARLGGAFVALGCGIWAVSALPLSTATTLGFTQVFFVSGLARVALKEPFGPWRLGATALGFLGVLVVMRPGAGGIVDPRALIPLAGALGAAVAVTSVRRLAQSESTATLLAYQSLFVGLMAGLPMLWLWRTPDAQGLALLLAMGVVAMLGQWAGVRALRLGEAGLVGNLEYMKLVYAILLGAVLFDEWPAPATLAGAGLIVLASALVLRGAR